MKCKNCLGEHEGLCTVGSISPTPTEVQPTPTNPKEEDWEELERDLTSYQCCMSRVEGTHKEDAAPHWIITQEDLDAIKSFISHHLAEARREQHRLDVASVEDAINSMAEGHQSDKFVAKKLALSALIRTKPESRKE